MGLGKGKIHCTVGKQTSSEKGLHLGWGKEQDLLLASAMGFVYGLGIYYHRGKTGLQKLKRKLNSHSQAKR